MKRHLLFFILAILLPAATQAQLDPTFGNGGYAYTSVNSNNLGACVLIDTLPNRNTLMLGMSDVTTFLPQTVIMKFHEDGSTNSSFGANGLFVFPDSLNMYGVTFMKSQPDGKILVGGEYRRTGMFDPYILFMMRVLADGSGLDTSFGHQGIDTIDMLQSTNYFGGAALQSDGKIVVLGKVFSYDFPSGYGLGIARLFPNGGIDSSFGINGRVFKMVGANYNEAKALTVLPDDRIVAAGFGDNIPASGNDFVVLRYLPDGRPDSSLNQTGIKYANNNAPGYGLLTDMKVQADGKMLLVGGGVVNTDSFVVVRLNVDGSKDTSFNHTGEAMVEASVNALGKRSLALQPDNKILILGKYMDGSKESWEIVRLKPNGDVDGSFGNQNGRLRMSLNPNAASDWFFSMVIENTGKILVAGLYVSNQQQRNRVYARFNTNATTYITDPDAKPSLTCYPNPAHERINWSPIIQNKISRAVLYTLQGQRVLEVAAPEGGISVGHLPDGAYLLVLTDKDNLSVYRQTVVIAQ